MTVMEELSRPKSRFDHAEWQELRTATADDKIDYPTVLEKLEALGRTEGDLTNDVGTLKYRRRWAAEIAGAKQAAADKITIQAEIDAEEQRFADLAAEHRQRLQPLMVRLDEAQAAMLGAIGLDAELRRTCNDPDLRRQLRESEHELQQLNAKLNELRARQGVLRSQHADAVGHEYRERARECQRRITVIEAEQSDVRGKMATVSRRIEEIQAAKLVPEVF